MVLDSSYQMQDVWHRVPALLGFNLGVELGQIAIVAALAVIGMLSWRKLPLQLPANTALCGLGVFWFVNRLYF